MTKNNPSKRILGIDPGSNILGFGAIQVSGNRIKLIELGVINVSKTTDSWAKYKQIFEGILEVIKRIEPDEMALEAPFYGKNIQSMLKLGRAQGMAIAAGLSMDLPIEEYLPKRVKQSITGNGNASKEQLAAVLLSLVSKQAQSKYLDATDALAVAVCHHFSQNSVLGANKPGKAGGWGKFLQDNADRII